MSVIVLSVCLSPISFFPFGRDIIDWLVVCWLVKVWFLLLSTAWWGNINWNKCRQGKQWTSHREWNGIIQKVLNPCTSLMLGSGWVTQHWLHVISSHRIDVTITVIPILQKRRPRVKKINLPKVIQLAVSVGKQDLSRVGLIWGCAMTVPWALQEGNRFCVCYYGNSYVLLRIF